jgi:chromosome-anchoring protein RacA
VRKKRETINKRRDLVLNTRSVAELLGISTSTVQRWVKQLKLEMERNEQGHFIFTEEKINILKEVKQQLQEGILLHDITLDKTKRTGVIKAVSPELNKDQDQLEEKVNQIEISLNKKADSVVSYQLLQHRREIDELQEQVSSLTDRIVELERLLLKQKEVAATSEDQSNSKELNSRKKKNFFKALFGS